MFWSEWIHIWGKNIARWNVKVCWSQSLEINLNLYIRNHFSTRLSCIARRAISTVSNDTFQEIFENIVFIVLNRTDNVSFEGRQGGISIFNGLAEEAVGWWMNELSLVNMPIWHVYTKPVCGGSVIVMTCMPLCVLTECSCDLSRESLEIQCASLAHTVSCRHGQPSWTGNNTVAGD